MRALSSPFRAIMSSPMRTTRGRSVGDERTGRDEMTQVAERAERAGVRHVAGGR